MRKLPYLLLPLLAVMTLSFVNAPNKPGLMCGDKLPTLSLDNLSGGELNLKPHQGEFVIINFWASYDAASRINNVKLYNAYKRLDPQQYRFVSVSLDPSTTVFNETIRLDGIDPTTQYNSTEGESSTLFQKFHLNRGFATYIINDKGVIVSLRNGLSFNDYIF